jgi:hypothetical protein
MEREIVCTDLEMEQIKKANPRRRQRREKGDEIVIKKRFEARL